jgi:surfactin synthase thioesterase subunit
MSETNDWISCPKPNPEADVRLFCFPYAGGGKVIYREWPTRLPENIEVNIIELPGRWPRLNEDAFTDCAALVRALKPNLLTYQDKPIAFFGHSMGALISFELARSLRREHSIEPVHLFVSGSAAPQFGGLKPRTYDLPEPEFIEELRRLNGTPKEVLANEELMQLIIPMLRADLAVCQTYEYVDEPAFRCPISAFGGVEDREASRKRLEAWRKQTTGAFSLRMLPGDHFFLHTATTPILQAISDDLDSHRVRQ